MSNRTRARAGTHTSDRGQTVASDIARDGERAAPGRHDDDRNGPRARPRSSAVRTWLRRLLCAVVALIALAPALTAAHPHVFVEYGVVVLIGTRGIEGVQIGYTFDPLFTSMILQTFDTDGDGTLSRKEIRVIEQKHFSNLREYDYFVTLRSGDRALPVTPRDFDVRLPRDRATYLFTVPVRGLDGAGGEFEITVDDPTFYTAFFLREEQPVQVKGTSPYQVQCAVRRDATGMLPDAVRCEYRKGNR